jgi:hypothetical protein
LGASGTVATPQAQFAARGERAADHSETFSIAIERRERPFAGGEIHPPRRAVRNDVNRVEITSTFERARNLPRRRHEGVKHSRLNSRPQPGKDRLDIVDRRIDEKKLRDVRHVRAPHATLATSARVS